MKVSVIVPVYNHARYLRQRLDSIINQTYKDYELIILDDASTDNSREIILEYAGKYPDIITCFNEQNSGSPFIQWNKGVSLSSGEYIWIAESDDIADTNFIETVLDELTKSKDIGLVFTDTWVLDEEKRIRYRFSDRKVGKNRITIVKCLTLGYIVENPIPNASSIIFRKTAYVNAGYADESMKFCADWFMSLKIVLLQQVIYLPKALSTYTLHKSSSYHRHYINNIVLFEKWKICVFLIRNSGLSLSLYFEISKCMFKTLFLRFIHLVRLPSRLIPEIPRRPRKLIEVI